MRAYMGYWAGAPEEGACLIFAHTAREAKKFAYATLYGWCSDCEWIHVSVKWLRHKYFMQLKEIDEPHVIESPPGCKHCENWGVLNENSICSDCEEGADKG